LFYQGTWQRIFAARNSRTLLKGFVFSGLLSFPVIAAMGLFGLAFVGLSLPGDGSTALFTIVLNEAPYWLMVGIILFGLALIMSSADSTISGLNSLFIVDFRRMFPRMNASELKVISRYLLVILSMIALYVASQGLSILYLFLLADLLCCAAAFPVFFGFYSQRYQSYQAIIGILSGIVAGLFFFPLPGEAALHLYEAFLLATFVPVVVSLVLLLLPVSKRFEFSTVAKQTELLFSGK
jgi:Na+/proline symporter